MDTDLHICAYVSCQDRFLGEFARLHNGDGGVSQNLNNNSKLPGSWGYTCQLLRFSSSISISFVIVNGVFKD